MRLISALLCSAMIASAETPPYEQTIKYFQARYEEGLKAPDGWLAVAGLSWLHEGVNTVGSDAANDVVLPKPQPARMGTLILASDHATFDGQTLVSEKGPIFVNGLSLSLIERNHKFAIRLRDPHAETREHFTGNRWFPIAESYRIEARWVPYPSGKTIPIQSILGYAEQQTIPGYAEFKLHGQTFRLEPIVEEPGTLFFVFRDETAGHETYPAGRFLNTPDPKDGKVILDFNQAYNPPCAFTAFATCPLPPRQNQLAVRIPAGELNYGTHR